MYASAVPGMLGHGNSVQPVVYSLGQEFRLYVYKSRRARVSSCIHLPCSFQEVAEVWISEIRGSVNFQLINQSFFNSSLEVDHYSL